MFSFNAPYGKCDYCDGLGTLFEIDEKLVIPNKKLSIMEGAIASWGEGRLKKESWTFAILKALCKEYNFSLDTPIEDLPKEIVDILLYGTKGKKLSITYVKDGTKAVYNYAFEGEINALRRRYNESNSDFIKDGIEAFMSDKACPKCHGARLKSEVLSVKINGKNIIEFTQMPIKEELDFINNLNFSEKKRIISDQIVREIKNRLQFLVDVGLDYLNLSRKSGTLSGGEAQRIRLATQIGSSLMGVLYILDEPSIGLHQRDNDKLIGTLQKLRDVGNTVIVVEHDEDTMKAADYIVDIGPGAGEHGGEVIACGTAKEIMKCKKSITGQYLSGAKKIEVPALRREGNGKKITIKIDRPLGTRHPKHNFIYLLNYGYVPNTISDDGEELDAYLLGVFDQLKEYHGKVIAIIHRTNDNDDKLVVVPDGVNYTDDQIMALTEFQERFFKSVIWR